MGKDARFNGIFGFTQISATSVIVSDRWNHCLRKVDRLSLATYLFAGNCTDSGFEDGFNAKFYFTWSVVKDAVNDSLILVADYGNNAIRTVRKYDGFVETFVESWKLNWVRSLTQESATGDIYALAHDALYLISYTAKTIIKLNGQFAYTLATYIDGPLQKAQFSYPNEFLMVASKIVMVSDKSNLKV
mgnify:CR=1 FL=1